MLTIFPGDQGPEGGSGTLGTLKTLNCICKPTKGPVAPMHDDALLTKLKHGRHGLKPELVEALQRLQRGQHWLVVTWLDIRDQDDWGDQADTFSKAYDTWDLLEAETRQKYGYRECVIGPQGCDEDAPIRCDWCISGPTPPEANAPTNTPQAPANAGEAEQPAMFAMTTRPD